jgi:uncharacterized protein (TIGR03067 family)
MKNCAVLVLFAGSSIAAAGAGDAAKEEHKKLDGEWTIESVLRDPREPIPEEGKGMRCIIKDEKLVAKLPGNDKPAGELVLRIDPTKRPKTLDVRPRGEKDTILAIYELKDDTLRVCLSPLGKERPKEIASKPGSGVTLVVLKRAKP